MRLYDFGFAIFVVAMVAIWGGVILISTRRENPIEKRLEEIIPNEREYQNDQENNPESKLHKKIRDEIKDDLNLLQ